MAAVVLSLVWSKPEVVLTFLEWNPDEEEEIKGEGKREEKKVGGNKGRRDGRKGGNCPPFHIHIPLFSLSLENILMPVLLRSETKGLSQTVCGKGDKNDLGTPQKARVRFRNH